MKANHWVMILNLGAMFGCYSIGTEVEIFIWTKAECRAGHAPLAPNLAPGPVGSQPLQLCYCYAKLVWFRIAPKGLAPEQSKIEETAILCKCKVSRQTGFEVKRETITIELLEPPDRWLFSNSSPTSFQLTWQGWGTSAREGQAGHLHFSSSLS